MAKGEGVRVRTLRNGRKIYDVHWSVAGRKYQKRGFATKKDALTYRRAQLHAADRGAFVAPSGLSFGAYLRMWLDARPRSGTTATYRPR